MPRQRKPARLYFRKDEGQWIIRDGNRMQRTGFSFGQRGEAEKALADYLTGRQPEARRGPAHPGELTVGEVLARYVDDKGAKIGAAGTLAYSVQALAPFWADLTCDAVKGSTCRLYERERAKPRTTTTTTKTGKTITRTLSASPSTVRRELGVLQAALNHAHSEGLLIHPIAVTLPEAGEPRDRWLTRKEVAALVWCAEPHVRRFIILSIYTGRRASAILELIWTRVDLDTGVIRFRAEGQAETNKRRGRIRAPRQLRGHLLRWKGYRGTHVVSFRGKPIASIKTGIRRAAERAGIEGVTPHVLKHTAITWAVMKGLSVEDAAEYFDTSPETIRKHYWHHSPHHQERALEIIERR
ncbi:Site-specific recombinase XerD [Thioclava dalianensis]|uniref:tyrosine-type recombinase/integrase n=1 Tax=Thioclava dalianensis TaxID=1185766 RepID=UPI0008F688E0|nr:site-specific integrase [Thioclava dalianensis]SFN84530.1 Site-specific recombinase XerD [Thioclava dalianensis]